MTSSDLVAMYANTVVPVVMSSDFKCPSPKQTATVRQPTVVMHCSRPRVDVFVPCLAQKNADYTSSDNNITGSAPGRSPTPGDGKAACGSTHR